jgi:hypothetical protein
MPNYLKLLLFSTTWVTLCRSIIRLGVVTCGFAAEL